MFTNISACFQAGAAFSAMGSIVGWVVPRCSDPSISVSHLAIDLMLCLMKISAKYEGMFWCGTFLHVQLCLNLDLVFSFI